MKKTVYLTSKQDGLKLHVLLMEPEQSPKGIVQICHGMAEHKERYEPFMQMLCNNGYISVIHDHRGHGKSVKDAVDLGYFYDDSGKAIIEDAHQVTTWMKERYGGELPYHLFGHSMGSLVVRCYLKKYDDELDSLIVCGSPSENKAAKAAGFLAKTACKMGAHKKGWQVKHPSLPILFIAGADDPCIGSKKQYAQAMTTLKKRGYNQVRGMLFLNRRHEILNEDDVEKVYDAVLHFLEQHSKRDD